MSLFQKIGDKIFQLSPIGAADQKLRSHLERVEIDLTEYERSLKSYRLSLAAFNISRMLFYAGLINSVASTFNIWGAGIIQQIASYVGVTVVLALYTVTKHIKQRREELYRVERELILNKAD
jgi:hypothetical protein